LSQFLGPETDPATKLDGTFKIEQEGTRKDVERGFGVLKIQFLALTHPINLHHRDDIFYLILSTIFSHNMMVEESVSNNKMEDDLFYNITDPNDSDDNSTEDNDDVINRRNGGYGNSPLERHAKFKMVHRRWDELYDYGGQKHYKMQ